MIKTKAKGKAAETKKAKKRTGSKGKKELNPAEVRKEIAQMVDSEASKMAEAVIGEGKKGQLATVKYLFEMAGVYPPLTDGSQATTDEDCLAKTLLDRLNIPDTVGRDEEDEPVRTSSPAAGGKEEKESNKLPSEPESSETDGEESKHVSALV